MLTQSELVWLQERRTTIAPCGASWNWCRKQCGIFSGIHSCLLASDYRDAAEFEARVAVIAANGAQPCLVDGHCPEGKERECERYNICFTRCGLKYARLLVESVLDDIQNEAASDE